jgi:hypothetical protein
MIDDIFKKYQDSKNKWKAFSRETSSIKPHIWHIEAGSLDYIDLLPEEFRAITSSVFEFKGLDHLPPPMNDDWLGT